MQEDVIKNELIKSDSIIIMFQLNTSISRVNALRKSSQNFELYVPGLGEEVNFSLFLCTGDLQLKILNLYCCRGCTLKNFNLKNLLY